MNFKVGDRVYCDVVWEDFGYGTIVHISGSLLYEVSIDRVPAGITSNDRDIFLFSHKALTPAFHQEFLEKIKDRMGWKKTI